jgi:type IV pilus assembly protein PilA
LPRIVLGHLALAEIRKSAGRLGGQGIAVAGLVLGYLGVAVIPFVLILAAIAIPNLLRARMAANEASTVGALRRIHAAESWYASKYKNGFSASLDAFAKEDDDQDLNCEHAGVISSNLANGTIYGYASTYVPRTADGKAPIGRTARSSNSQCSEAGTPKYELTADPVQRGVTGQRSFYTDETGVIRYERGDAASAKSPPLQ